MLDTKQLMRYLKRHLNQRIDEILGCINNNNGNRLQQISIVSKRENYRQLELSRSSPLIYDTLKKESPQSIQDKHRFVYQLSLNIFRKINNKFEFIVNNKIDFYSGTVKMYRNFFVQSDDIRMVAKIQQLQRNKALKKPLVLNILLKYLLQLTRSFFQLKLNLLNQSITPKDLENYQNIKNNLQQKTSSWCWEQSVQKQTKLKEAVSRNRLGQSPLIIGFQVINDNISQQLIEQKRTKVKYSNNRLFYLSKPTIDKQQNNLNQISDCQNVASPRFFSKFKELGVKQHNLMSNTTTIILKNTNNNILDPINNKEQTNINNESSDLTNKKVQKKNETSIIETKKQQSQTCHLVGKTGLDELILKRKLRQSVPIKIQSQIYNNLSGDRIQIFNRLYGILDIEQKSIQHLLKGRSIKLNQYSLIKFAYLQSKLRNKYIFKSINEISKNI